MPLRPLRGNLSTIVVALALVAAARAGATECPDGHVAVERGHCCWPGQRWKGEACAGVPTGCPPAMEVRAEACAPAPSADAATDDLIASATGHDLAAMRLRFLAGEKGADRESLLARSRAESATAAAGYARALARDDMSDARMYQQRHADSLFFAGAWREAAAAFEVLRDAPGWPDRVDAARSAALAREHIVKEVPGRPEVPQSLERLTEQDGPLPDDEHRLQEAYDAIARISPHTRAAAQASMTAAAIDLRYHRLEQARARLDALLVVGCDFDGAEVAANTLLQILVAQRRLDDIVTTTERLVHARCLPDPRPRAGTLDEATKLYEAHEWARAAAAFDKLLAATANPSDVLLNNAAFSFEAAKQRDRALVTWERLASTSGPHVDDALFRIGVLRQRTLDFEGALAAYSRLATRPEFGASPHRADALYNCAALEEALGRPRRAAALFRQYASRRDVVPDEAARVRAHAASLEHAPAKPRTVAPREHIPLELD
jgi:hypothetical protein